MSTNKEQSGHTRRVMAALGLNTFAQDLATTANHTQFVNETTSNVAAINNTLSNISVETNALQVFDYRQSNPNDPTSWESRILALENAPPSGGGGIDPSDPTQPIIIVDNFLRQSNGEPDGTGGLYIHPAGEAEILNPFNLPIMFVESETGHPGMAIVRLNQFDTVINSYNLGQTQTADICVWTDVNQQYFIIKTPNTLEHSIRIGFMDDFGSSPSANEICFERLTGEANISVVTRNGGTQTKVSTGVAYSANTWYTFKISRAALDSVDFTVNAVLVNQTTNIPTAMLNVGTQIVGNGSNLVDEDFIFDFFSLKLGDIAPALPSGASVIGTTNEIEVTTVGPDFQVGLPNNITVVEASIDQLNFDTTVTTPTLSPGEVSWDTTHDGLIMQVSANIHTPINHATYQRVWNNSGLALAKGDIVYVTGSHASEMATVAKALANAEFSSAPTIGLCAEAIGDNSSGRVITHGLLRGVTTTGYSAGQTIFLDEAVSGAWRTTHPAAPNHGTFVGWIVKVAGGGAGSIFVKVHNYNEIAELSDVYIPTTPTGGDVLQYDSGDSRWENKTLAAAGIAATGHTHTLDDLSNVTVPSPASKDSICWNSGTSTWVNSPVWIDPTNPSSPVIFVDDFLNQNNETGEVGNNAWTFSNLTIPQWAGELDHPGIIRLRCSGTANILGYMSTCLTNAGSTNQFNIDNLQEFTIVFREVQTDSDTYRVYGVCGTVTSTTALIPGIYLRKNTLGSWHFVTRNGGGSETSTLFLTSDTNWHKMKVTYTAGSVSFYMDGATSPTATHTTNIPTNLIVSPYIVLIPTGTSLLRTTDIDFISYKLNPNR